MLTYKYIVNDELEDQIFHYVRDTSFFFSQKVY